MAPSSTVKSILDAATALFAMRGAEGVSVLDIARRGNVSSGTVIYHFKSKDNLLFIVSREILSRLYRESREAMAAAATPLQGVHAFIDAFFSLAQDCSDAVMFLGRFDPFTRLDLDSFPMAELVVLKKQYIGLVEECVSAGSARGLVNPVDPRLFALTIWAALQGVCRLYSQNSPMDGLALELKSIAAFRLTGSLCGEEVF